jgi:hypothetical protein
MYHYNTRCIMNNFNPKLQELLLNGQYIQQQAIQEKTESFVNALSSSLTTDVREERDRKYHKAGEMAINTVLKAMCLPFEEVLKIFNATLDDTGKYIAGTNEVFRNQKLTKSLNEIKLDIPADEHPTYYDERTSKRLPIIFRTSWVYSKESFRKRISEYYSGFNVDITFEDLGDFRWKITFTARDGIITTKKE